MPTGKLVTPLSYEVFVIYPPRSPERRLFLKSKSPYWTRYSTFETLEAAKEAVEKSKAIRCRRSDYDPNVTFKIFKAEWKEVF